MSLNRQSNNPTYIVALSTDPIAPGSPITFKGVVEDFDNYYFAAAKDRRGWPHPRTFNFIGFHNIDTLLYVRPVLDYTRVMPEETRYLQGMTQEPHWLLTLGPPVESLTGKPLGKVFPKGRKWADLDHLEASRTVWDACELSKRVYGK